MAYFNTCPACGCNLDPGEHCDCAQEKEKEKGILNSMLLTGKSGQMTFCFTKEGKPLEKAVI
ncbi:MAG: hypothetical protein ACERKN_13685 [Velocimicrobium sp.]